MYKRQVYQLPSPADYGIVTNLYAWVALLLILLDVYKRQLLICVDEYIDRLLSRSRKDSLLRRDGDV